MTKNPIRTISIVLLLLSVLLWTTVIFPSMQTAEKAEKAKKQSSWQEQLVTLTAMEQATMSADFASDFKKNLDALDAPATPTLFLPADVPASMAGDLIAPTVSIQGGAQEGTTVANPNVCFSLWVSDNMTPWQQLGTRAKMDTMEWSTWLQMTSYCFPNLADGAHTFTVQIRDLTGNVSPEVKRVFSVKR